MLKVLGYIGGTIPEQGNDPSSVTLGTDRVRGRSKMSGAVIWEELSNVTWWGLRDRVFRRGRTPAASRPIP